MTEQRRYTPKTVTLRLSAVKAFLTYAAYEDLTLVALSQSAKALKAPAGARRPIEFLTEAQTRAILAAFTGQTAKSRRNRMLLILLYDTAARVGEITGLTLQDLHLIEPGYLLLSGKGNNQRLQHRANDPRIPAAAGQVDRTSHRQRVQRPELVRTGARPDEDRVLGTRRSLPSIEVGGAHADRAIRTAAAEPAHQRGGSRLHRHRPQRPQRHADRHRRHRRHRGHGHHRR